MVHINHLEMHRCNQNFARPLGALRFGTEVQTPAMQTGHVARKLSLRGIFTTKLASSRFVEARSESDGYKRAG